VFWQPCATSARANEPEEALRDSESRYRALVEAFDGFIYICSRDHKIEFMNANLIARTNRGCHRRSLLPGPVRLG